MGLRCNAKAIMHKTKYFIYNSIRGVNRMNKSYTIVIHREQDPNGYWAECLDVEGCFAQAETIDEVKELMKECIIMNLEKNEKTNSTKNIDIVLSYA